MAVPSEPVGGLLCYRALFWNNVVGSEAGAVNLNGSPFPALAAAAYRGGATVDVSAN
jgi:hypothetical protein